MVQSTLVPRFVSHHRYDSLIFNQDRYCFIDNTCYDVADANPQNPDLVCDPERDIIDWTDRNGLFLVIQKMSKYIKISLYCQLQDPRQIGDIMNLVVYENCIDTHLE